MVNKDLKKRILDISYKYHLSHIGSNLTAVNIIDEIYKTKKKEEAFILSSGHAGLALYCVLEKYTGKNAEDIFNHHGVHPDRCGDCGIDCSSGSLGHGLGIAAGMALAHPEKHVYVLCSDGELAEGSCFEAVTIIRRQNIANIRIYINENTWAAYRRTYVDSFFKDHRITIVPAYMENYPEWLQGQQAHYVVMDEKMYQEALEILK